MSMSYNEDDFVEEEEAENDLKVFSHKYFGNYDAETHLRRDLNATEIWQNLDSYQKYSGTFLYGNLHKLGVYLIEDTNNRLYYNGQFCVNNLHSYCSLFYKDCTVFEGLFCNNRKFGPGVLTEPNPDGSSSQNVGLWLGKHLFRLIVTIAEESVPKLASTSLGRIKLLQYRNLVSVSNDKKREYVAEEVLHALNANEDILKSAPDKMYDFRVRHPNCLFFDKEKYKLDFESENEFIDVETEDLEVDISATSSDIDASKDLEYTQQLKQQILKIEGKLGQLNCFSTFLYNYWKSCKHCCQMDENTNSNDPVELEYCGEYETVCPNCYPDYSFDNFQTIESKLEAVKLQEQFYETIKSNLELKMQRNLSDIKIAERKTKKIAVSDLVAFNNEKIQQEMLIHIFQNRKQEHLLSYNVEELIRGKRGIFRECGSFEKICREFLLNCHSGNEMEVRKQLFEDTVNPDLCDGNGNTGILLATNQNRTGMIKILVDFGANVDVTNDEGITPLNLCLLKYLAIIYGVESGKWEDAFLKDLELQNDEKQSIIEWRPHFSLLNLTDYVTGNAFTPNNTNVSLNTFSFTSYPKAKTNESIKMSNKANFSVDGPQISFFGKKDFDSYIFSLKYENTSIKTVILNDEQQNDLNLIVDTLTMLLNFGSEISANSTPQTALFMSLFTRNVHLVDLLSNVDINQKFGNHNLNCLHVICALPPSQQNYEILQLLLRKKCNVNAKCTDFWTERAEIIIGKTESGCQDNSDERKNPLHLLCMRMDSDFNNYLGRMAADLVNAGIFQDFYLGHSFLSLAVLHGNLEIVKSLFDTRKLDPYKELGRNMGNILTLLLLKRYANHFLTRSEIENVLKFLVNTLNVNPLRYVGNFENSIAFIEDELKPPPKLKKDKVTSTKTKHKKQKTKAVKKAVKQPKIKSKLLDCLKSLSRGIMIKFYQMKIVKILYNLLEDKRLCTVAAGSKEEVILSFMCKYLQPQIALECLEKLFQSETLHRLEMNMNCCLDLLQFVAKYSENPKSKKKSRKKSRSLQRDRKSDKSSQNSVDKNVVDYNALLNKANFEPNKQSVVPIPGSKDDSKSKYNVCFYCLKQCGKTLKSCPGCFLISYCSLQCNKLGNSLKVPHYCNLLFYGNETEQTNLLQRLIEDCTETCQKRLNEKLKKEAAAKMQKLAALKRADVYGTLSLKNKPSKNIRSHKPEETKNFTAPTCVTYLSLLTDTGNVPETDRQVLNLEVELLSNNYECQFLSPLEFDWEDSSNDDDDDTEEKKSIQFCCRKDHNSKKAFPTLSNLIDATTSAKSLEEKACRGAGVDKLLKEKSHRKGKCNCKTAAAEKQVVLTKIPQKYQYFMALLQNYFPETDFSWLLLPYACYADGQLYYKFSGLNLFAQTYSST